MTQYIFVDVDGVLNPDVLRPGGERLLALPHGGETPGYYLNLHKDYGKWLKQLSENTEAFLVWGSTWQGYANKWVGEYLELPHLSHLDLSEKRFSENLGSVKGRQAVTYANGSKFVYFDDEVDIGHCIVGSKGLHIVIDNRTGLQESHIQIAENYLKS
jgi:hypothetical protein